MTVAPLMLTSTFRLTMSFEFAASVVNICGSHDTSVMPSATAYPSAETPALTMFPLVMARATLIATEPSSPVMPLPTMALFAP